MFTRKHFEQIAATINQARLEEDDNFTGYDRGWDQGWNKACDELAYKFSAIFRESNPRFDSARFVKACGIPEHQEAA